MLLSALDFIIREAARIEFASRINQAQSLEEPEEFYNEDTIKTIAASSL